MYTQNHFTDLEQQHSDFLQDQSKVIYRLALQSFTDPGHKQKQNVSERKAWTVQYNGPFPLESQRVSLAQMFHNEQTSSDDVKDAVKDIATYRQMTR